MNPMFENPFASIEDTREFLTLLAQTIFETKLEIEADVQRESDGNFSRRKDALNLALYTLTRLEFHMIRSRRLLNDLRTLRRLMFEERTVTALSQRPQLDGKARAEVLLPPPSSRRVRVADRTVATA